MWSKGWLHTLMFCTFLPLGPNIQPSKNKFNKTAIDYAFKAGHGKKIIPLLQASIELRLKLERTMGFEVDEEAYQAALTFNFEDKGRVKQLKK